MTAGDIYTIAGTGAQGFSGDGGPATSAGLAVPDSVAVDAAGNLVIADYGDNRVRVVAASTGTLLRPADDRRRHLHDRRHRTQGFSGDGGPAASATLHYPQGVAVDGSGNVLVTDSGNNRLRMITGSSSGAAAARPAARARAPPGAPGGRAGPPGSGRAATSGPFVTLLFSRSETAAADNCVPDDSGIAPLDTVVAPYLRSLGLTGTGSLVTGVTQATAPDCTHSGDSLTSSWADAANLATNFGWSFVSHTATYPSQLGKLTPTQSYAETCGSAAALDAHGLPGGARAHRVPRGADSPVRAAEQLRGELLRLGADLQQVGDDPRLGRHHPAVLAADRGGQRRRLPCQDAPCYNVAAGAGGNLRYDEPSTIIAKIQALQPGQWFTLQAYILVTGSSPSYAHNTTHWDCTSPNPALHWTNDNERYCYSDWQQIVSAIAAMPDVTVTDPLTVGVAFGRPATYP